MAAEELVRVGECCTQCPVARTVAACFGVCWDHDSGPLSEDLHCLPKRHTVDEREEVDRVTAGATSIAFEAA